MTNSTCLNLQALYGDRYRITFDPAAKLERNGRRDPWQFVIPCKYGGIFPFNETQLAVMVCGSRKVPEARGLGLTIHQDGDTEAIFLFAPRQFGEVAKIAKPRKKRQVTEKQRQRLAEIGRACLFQSKNHGVQITLSDSGDVPGRR